MTVCLPFLNYEQTVTQHHTRDHTWNFLPCGGVTYSKASKMRLHNKYTGTDKALSDHLT